MLRVAVVGSGPAGLYTAEALIKQAALLPTPVTIKVDVIDRLPTPYGLVRYGVAPDHKSIKSVANYLRRVLESPDVRFVGGVTLGVDVTREELLAAYDAVVYATGAMRDRRLGHRRRGPARQLRRDRLRQLVLRAPGRRPRRVHPRRRVGRGDRGRERGRRRGQDPGQRPGRARGDRHPRAGDGRAARVAGPRGARDRPARPRPGQVHHQGAARAGRAGRRRGLGPGRRVRPRGRLRPLRRVGHPGRRRPPRPRQPGRDGRLERRRHHATPPPTPPPTPDAAAPKRGGSSGCASGSARSRSRSPPTARSAASAWSAPG